MGENYTAPELTDTDDSVSVKLPDGSEVEVYGDGLVYLYLNGRDDAPAVTVNLYVPDENVNV